MKRIHEATGFAAKKLCSGRAKKAVIICVLLIQAALIVFWAGQRSNYYIDELFSFGSAHAYALPKENAVYITSSEKWQYEEWIENSVLKEELEITSKESLLSRPPLRAIRLILTGRNYHGILNVLMSAFSPGKVSAYPAAVLNLILFLFTQLVLYSTMKRLTGSFSISLLTILMYGFSAMAISTVLYVRFYMLVTLLLLALVCIHQIMWQEERLLRCELLTVLGMALIYLAMKDSELVFILAGSLVTAYAVALIIGRQFKKAVFYIVTVFPVSIAYAVIKTNFFDIVLHPSNYVMGDGAEAWMTDKLLTVNKERLISLVFKYLGWVSDLLFGSWYVLCCFLVLILILLEIWLFGKKRHSRLQASPEGRRRGFIWVIAAVCAVYYVFSLLVAIPAERYFMYYFPLLAILLWKLLHELTRGLRYRREVLLVCCALVCIGAAALQIVRPEKIDFVYREDRPLIRTVQDSGIQSVIVIYTGERDSNHSAYDCLNLMPDTARLYPIDRYRHHIDASECPDKLLIWIHGDRQPEPYITDLLDEGFVLQQLGQTHASDVYLAQRT